VVDSESGGRELTSGIHRLDDRRVVRLNTCMRVERSKLRSRRRMRPSRRWSDGLAWWGIERRGRVRWKAR